MSIKVAMVNIATEVVENIIVVDTLEDPAPTGYILAEIPIVTKFASPQDEELYYMLKEIDPDFEFNGAYQGPVDIKFSITRWNAIDGFY